MQSWRLEHVGRTYGAAVAVSQVLGGGARGGTALLGHAAQTKLPPPPPCRCGRPRARTCVRAAVRACARYCFLCSPCVRARARVACARAGPRRDVALTIHACVRNCVRACVRARARVRPRARARVVGFRVPLACARAYARACARADVRCVRACEHLWDPKPPVVQAPVEPQDPVRVHLLSDVIPQHSARIAQAAHQQHADGAANPRGAARGPVPR